MDSLYFIIGFFSFWMGACIASFLNVVIWRVPRGESIVSPPSHCPRCNSRIKWYHNLPIVAWLALRGRCANCKAPISPRYILIETIGGILFLAVYIEMLGEFVVSAGEVPPFAVVGMVVMWIWTSLMIVGSMIDFDHKLLPDFVTVGGMILGVVWNGVDSALLGSWLFILDSVAGLVIGFGLMWLIRFIGGKVFHREAMGMGDVFLMGAVGALFGPVAVLVTLILSSVFGSVVGVGLITLSRTKSQRFFEIPYGPYICMGCLVWMFWGPEIINWYLNLLGIK